MDSKKGLLLLSKDDRSYKPPNKRTTNTDNKLHLFVMVFALAPATRTAPYDRDTRISRQYSHFHFCTLTNFWLRSNLYRDTALVLLIK